MISYGQSIHWASHGGTTTVTVEDCDSPEEAMQEAIEAAKSIGWTPPQWWQFWRWAEPVRHEPR